MMRKGFLIGLFAILLLFSSSSCNPSPQTDVDESAIVPNEDTTTAAPTETPTLEPTTPAPEKSTYELTFNATWSAETHPADYDPSAHFSPFITYGHTDSPDALIFRENELASPGIEQMAETGATDLLVDEINTIIAGGYANDFIKGSRIDSPGFDSGKFGFSQSSSQVTFVSMIAPSPDWFVATTVNLFQDGQWIEELTLELISYDSGTDSGLTLTAADADTQPREPITRLPETLQKMGTLTLQLVN